MPNSEDRLKKFAIDLYKIDAIKFGEYKTKVGLMTPIYCDLRVIVSHPKILDDLAQLLLDNVQSIKNYDVICGVPYTALPIATVMSIKSDIPMVMRRKEAKNYGTKKMIEGTYKNGNTCLLVEDVITSGSSILETVKDLQNEGLVATNAVVVLNREQGGEKILNNNGVKVHALLTITKLMKHLFDAKLVDQSIVDKVHDYLKQSQVDSSIIQTPKCGKDRLKMSFVDRSETCNNKTSKKLLKIMSDKKSNLCVAVDLTSTTKILQLAEQLGPHICVLKLHVDIVEDFSEKFIDKLQQISTSRNFLIMEDRKFADIGNTVQLQFNKGMYQISKWADLVTAHSLPGKGLIQALNEADGEKRGIFLLAEMSSAGNLCSDEYANASVKLAQESSESVVGIVCQSARFTDTPYLIQLTPGIQLDQSGDGLGQQYNSPEYVVLEKGADIGVVGRGITMSENPVAAAENYKQLMWNAYLKRIEN